MKIAVDAGCLGVLDERLKVGVYNFASNILIELSKIDTENTYLLYSFHPIDKYLLKKLGPNMSNVIVRPMKGWLRVWLPIRMISDRVNVFLALGQAVPPRMSPTIQTIGVIYDLAFEKYKEEYGDSYTRLHVNTQYVAKKSKHILTISETVKKEIHKMYKTPLTNISVVSLGVRQFVKKKDTKTLPKGKYFLYVGSLKKIKNVPVILQAYEKFSLSTKREVELVLVGGNKWKDTNIEKVLNKMSDGTIEKISFRGYADDSEIHSLYKNAIAFVSPSLDEGFGLPFLEAMSEGCPVIGSDAGAIPEVVGKAGILVNPTDVQSLTRAMIDVYESPELRAKLSKKGLERSHAYSWEYGAKTVYTCLQKYS
jgi:glycosyltransferase involved in cell wall biosynthesis